MMFPFSYWLFFFTLITGSIMSISSPSWFGAWIGLELNLMSFIPLIATKMSSHSSESAVKYFLIQALGSTLLVTSSFLSISLSSLTPVLILASLLLKLGSAPFHFWFIHISGGLYWPQLLLLSTIQKLAPLILLSYISIFTMITKIILISATLSALVGAWGGLNLSFLPKIIAFSSVNHLSWMLAALMISDSLWFIYFLIYIIILISITSMFQKFQSFTLSDLMKKNINMPPFSLFLTFNLLSLGGLPPFLGFIPKWMIIQMMINMGFFFPLLIFLISTLITLYFYIRIIIPQILLNSFSMIINIKNNLITSEYPFLVFQTSINLLGLILPIYMILM